MPNVSIIMGVYNAEKTLAESLESIINQTYTDWQLIMCDDGSVDATLDIALKYAENDSRIIVIKNDNNKGLAYTLNHCLEYAEGKYIARHDADDLMVRNRLEKQVFYMEKYNFDACGSGAYVFDDLGIWGIRMPAEFPKKECMILGAPFIHPSVMLKKEVLFKIGGYRDSEITRKRLEDYDLWIRLFESNSALYNIQEPLIYFREDLKAYGRKKKEFRITEFKARMMACKKLGIPFYKRIGVLKPLVLALVPSSILQRYHRGVGRKELIKYQEKNQ